MAELIPEGIKYKVSDFKVYTPTVVTTSQSLKVIARSFPTHQYKCKLELIPTRLGDARDFSAWQESLSGRAKTLELQIPHKSKPRGLLGGSVSVNADYEAGDDVIAFQTQQVSVPNAVRRGDCFVFASHSKVYTAKNDASINSIGVVVVELTLPLLNTLSDGDSVTYTDVPFTMRQTEDTQTFKVSSSSVHADLVLDLEEVI